MRSDNIQWHGIEIPIVSQVQSLLLISSRSIRFCVRPALLHIDSEKQWDGGPDHSNKEEETITDVARKVRN